MFSSLSMTYEIIFAQFWRKVECESEVLYKREGESNFQKVNSFWISGVFVMESFETLDR